MQQISCAGVSLHSWSASFGNICFCPVTAPWSYSSTSELNHANFNPLWKRLKNCSYRSTEIAYISILWYWNSCYNSLYSTPNLVSNYCRIWADTLNQQCQMKDWIQPTRLPEGLRMCGQVLLPKSRTQSPSSKGFLTAELTPQNHHHLPYHHYWILWSGFGLESRVSLTPLHKTTAIRWGALFKTVIIFVCQAINSYFCPSLLSSLNFFHFSTGPRYILI